MFEIEAIRKRPGMYIGDPCTPAGIANVVAEFFANAADLYLAGKATTVLIHVEESGWVVIEDDGPGLPFDEIHKETGLSLIEKHLTVGHDAPTADGHLLPGFKIGLGDEVFCSRKGLADFVNTLSVNGSNAGNDFGVTEFFGKRDFCEINFACGGESDGSERPWTRSWANGIATNEGGVHVDGMLRALAKTHLRPAVAMISVILDDPRFGSPTRSRLSNPEIASVVESALTTHFIKQRLIRY